MTISGKLISNEIDGNIIGSSVSGSIYGNNITGKLIDVPTIIVNPYGPEATALFNRMTEQPTTALKILIDKTISDLKTTGIWDITDKFHKWDLHTEQASLLDWKNSTHDASNVDSTFTPKYGLTTIQYVSYVDLNFVPANDCAYASLNDIGFSLDDLTGYQTLGPNFGSYDKANTTFLGFRTMEIAAVRPWLWLNAKSQKVWNSNGGINLYYSERKDSTTVRIYKSATTSTFGTAVSSAMTDNDIIIGGYIASGGNVAQKHSIDTATFWLGKSFTDDQRAAWYDIIDYWKANVGSTF
jgi:hypothetical protein